LDAETIHRRRWWTLLVLCVSLIVITLDNTILNVALPTLVDELHATNSQLQWIVDGYTLVFAGLLLTAGTLGDRFGRKGALQLGLVVFALGSLLSAFATDPWHLIATRSIMGIGGAFIMPSTLSILTNVFKEGERGRAIGIWSGVAGLGVAIGPLAGGYLVDHIGWEAIFLVNLPIVAVGLIAGVFLIPSSKDPSHAKLDIPGAALSIVALSALVFGLIEAPSWGWTSSTILASFAVALVGFVLFALRELHTESPMLDISFFSNPRFTAASVAVSLVFFAMFGYSFLLTQYLQFVLDYSPSGAGLAMLPFALAMMVTAPNAPRLVERIGTKLVVTIGLSMVSISMLLQMQLTAESTYLPILWRMLFLSVGMGLTMAPATESIMGSLPLAKAGVGSAMNDTTRQVGGTLGVAIIGSVLSSIYGSKIVDVLSGTPAPQAAIDAASESLGGALRVAEQIGTQGEQLIAVARDAFVDGLHGGALVAAIAAGLGALVTALYLPAHARRADEVLQEIEFEAEMHTQGEHPTADGTQAGTTPDAST
jgi:EmrB/QacA subfamily drug resistance transporter